MAMKALEAGTGTDHEDAGIPKMLTRCEIALGGFVAERRVEIPLQEVTRWQH